MTFHNLTGVGPDDSDISDGSRAVDDAQPHDPAQLVAALTPERMEIIRLLYEVGSMKAEAIASSVARDIVPVRRDLECLLDLEIVDLDRDASYLFDFDRMRMTWDCPTPRARKAR